MMKNCPSCNHNAAYALNILAYSVLSETKAKATMRLRCQSCKYEYTDSEIVVDYVRLKNSKKL